MRYRDDEQGFSLLELVFVTAIIAILVGIVILTYTFTSTKSRAIACRSNQRIFLEASFLYQDTHSGGKPDTIDDLQPYISNFDKSVICPADGVTRLRYDPDSNTVICDIHH